MASPRRGINRSISFEDTESNDLHPSNSERKRRSCFSHSNLSSPHRTQLTPASRRAKSKLLTVDSIETISNSIGSVSGSPTKRPQHDEIPPRTPTNRSGRHSIDPYSNTSLLTPMQTPRSAYSPRNSFDIDARRPLREPDLYSIANSTIDSEGPSITPEERAWKGVDRVMERYADHGSITSADVLSPAVRRALHRDNEEDDESDAVSFVINETGAMQPSGHDSSAMTSLASADPVVGPQLSFSSLAASETSFYTHQAPPAVPPSPLKEIVADVRARMNGGKPVQSQNSPATCDKAPKPPQRNVSQPLSPLKENVSRTLGSETTHSGSTLSTEPMDLKQFTNLPWSDYNSQRPNEMECKNKDFPVTAQPDDVVSLEDVIAGPALHLSLEEHDCNNSMPSLATFQHEEPSAASMKPKMLSYGDLGYEEAYSVESPLVPPEPLVAKKDGPSLPPKTAVQGPKKRQRPKRRPQPSKKRPIAKSDTDLRACKESDKEIDKMQSSKPKKANDRGQKAVRKIPDKERIQRSPKKVSNPNHPKRMPTPKSTPRKGRKKPGSRLPPAVPLVQKPVKKKPDASIEQTSLRRPSNAPNTSPVKAEDKSDEKIRAPENPYDSPRASMSTALTEYSVGLDDFAGFFPSSPPPEQPPLSSVKTKRRLLSNPFSPRLSTPKSAPNARRYNEGKVRNTPLAQLRKGVFRLPIFNKKKPSQQPVIIDTGMRDSRFYPDFEEDETNRSMGLLLD